MKKQPLITIVTVCYNAEKLLEKTILNIQKQTYPNIEHFIVDGNSTDSTLELVKKWVANSASHVDFKWLSEADEGIYDAMNKGAKLAKGQYINFMNAGDCFLENDSLEKVFAQTPSDAQVIYGDYQARFETYKKIIQAKSLSEAWTRITICHQSVIYQTELVKEHPYSGKYITSDFEQLFTLFQKKYKFHYLGFPLADYSDDGVSAKAKIKIAQELLEYIPEYDKSFQTLWALRIRYVRVLVVETVRSILPISWFEKLEQLK
jgi:glycosyltransferase involved in cell wall biosynthesis